MIEKLVGEILEWAFGGWGLEYWERRSYEGVVRCLLLEDEVAVRLALDQLIEEGKEVGIPPIYLAWKKHRNLRVRKDCRRALGELGDWEEIEGLVGGKDVRVGVRVLMERYGKF